MTLNGTKTCIDTNECDPPGLCSQTCVDQKGSYKCLCADGYTLMPDGRTCKVQSKSSYKREYYSFSFFYFMTLLCLPLSRLCVGI